ncbi:MAG: XRE family transcriptional regulator [Maricaulis sp.]|nr:XRE family transcriptional regulator [Maricaulis sp.]HAQ36121.1 XRE family transcriptional regulator [Alphaproteobacteria bacterium]
MTETSKPLEKIFAGARLRRLRREKGLTQAEAAEALGLSASYLNLLERNQRPVTARVLLSLAEVFDLDMKSFAEGTDRQLLADLRDAAADPVLDSLALDRVELTELAETHPRAAEALTQLHQAYRQQTGAAQEMMSRISGGLPAAGVAESVRDALDARRNHFPELEEAAETLASELRLDVRRRAPTLEARLQEAHGVVVRVFEEKVMGGARRRLDFHARRLMLSEVMPVESRPFHMAASLALLEHGELIDRLADQPGFAAPEARTLYRIALANYTAGALVMPYAAFAKAAVDLRYDIARLQRRFEAGYEAVCHRLTTLQRPGAEGVPFFMVRVDPAGNVSKRYGGGVLAFARSGGSCPKWTLHEAFRTPERLIPQSFELPDGTRYLSVVKAVSRPGLPGEPPVIQAIAVGCEWDHAEKVVYGDLAGGLPPALIGLSCRLCERSPCAHRAFPPMGRKLDIDPWRRGVGPYSLGED